MGTPGNGDGWPEGGGPHEELPDLPADWGSIVIPDDAAELAAEAILIRRELREQARRATWRRRLGLAPTPGGAAPAPLRLPLFLMAVALLATLASLFTVVWPGQQRQATPARTTAGGTPGRALPALDLVGENGDLVPLRSLLPAVIILVDSCACLEQVDAASRVAPPGVQVVTVLSGRPVPDPVPARPTAGPGAVRSLADPAAELRGFLRVTAELGATTTLMAARSGEVVRLLPAGGSVTDYPADLAQLTTR
jgi:hypothetical protein